MARCEARAAAVLVASAMARQRLPVLSCAALLLFLLACSLPVFVVTSRSRAAAALSSSTDDDTSFELLADARAAPLSSRRPPAKQATSSVLERPGSPVLVWLARERGTSLEVHLLAAGSGGSPCEGVAEAGESAWRAALRILWACARLGGPPDVEFLQRLGGPAKEKAPLAEGETAVFVSLVRSERLRGDVELKWTPLAGVDASRLAPRAAQSLAAATELLLPFARTAGKTAVPCLSPGLLGS